LDRIYRIDKIWDESIRSQPISLLPAYQVFSFIL
jgi:hypothetical protein